MRHKLTIAEQIRGTEKALANPKPRNLPVTINIGTGSLATGDGTAVIELTYRIITF